jgi:hypothetical protein
VILREISTKDDSAIKKKLDGMTDQLERRKDKMQKYNMFDDLEQQNETNKENEFCNDLLLLDPFESHVANENTIDGTTSTLSTTSPDVTGTTTTIVVPLIVL